MSELKPCPFCGNTEPEFERVGTPRQSCIVACGECGARHESSDEGKDSGASWNRRAQPAQAGQVPITSETGNAPDQGASSITSESGKAGQVLTHRDVLEEWTNTTLEPCTHQEAFVRGARWAEQAVLAKRVPQWTATDDQMPPVGVRVFWLDTPSNMVGFDTYMGDGYSWASSHWMPIPPPPGIVSEKGGA